MATHLAPTRPGAMEAITSCWLVFWPGVSSGSTTVWQCSQSRGRVCCYLFWTRSWCSYQLELRADLSWAHWVIHIHCVMDARDGVTHCEERRWEGSQEAEAQAGIAAVDHFLFLQVLDLWVWVIWLPMDMGSPDIWVAEAEGHSWGPTFSIYHCLGFGGTHSFQILMTWL